MKIFKYLSLAGIASLLIGSCVPPQEKTKDLSFNVEGNFKGAEGDTVYLKLLKETGYEFVDSTIVDKNGKFNLTGSVSKPDFFVLHFSDPKKQITLIPDTCELIQISANYKDFYEYYNVTGSVESENVCNIMNKLNKTIKICDSLAGIYRSNSNAPNLAGIKFQLDSVCKIAIDSLRAFSEDFLKKNPKSLAQIVCLSQYITPRTPVFDPEKDIEFYENAATCLNDAYPDNFHTKKLLHYVDRIKMSIKGEKPLAGKITKGMTAPEIALKNTKGDTIKLSKYKGKYILVDFWASWSNVSELNSDNLQKVYWKYCSNNFTIYQVSLDEKYDSWKQGLKEQKIPWVNVSDLKNWNSKAALDYGVQELPCNFLIYPDFTIHETNLTAEELDQLLEDLVGKPVRKVTPKPETSDNKVEK
jgi:peroxiredoxin